MREPRLYLPGPLQSGTRCTLDGEIQHYLSRVLRLRRGARLVVFDGRGGEYGARLEQLDRSGAVLSVAEHRAVDREPPFELSLAQGIGRAERGDFAVQKAVELGATRIVPLLTEHGVVRLSAERAQRRVQHWRSIVTHACQQCGRNLVPEVDSVQQLEDWLAGYRAEGLSLMLDPDADTALSPRLHGGGPVTLLVGPEGGLSARELALARAAGFIGVRLGPRTLRTETATVAGLTAIQLLWGDLGGA